MRQRRALGYKAVAVTLRGRGGPGPAGIVHGMAEGAADGRGTTSISHRELDVRGLRMHVAEAGQGPLVVLLHGFPESWYSWRHQLTALAAAGFHAVAPDQRGYGQT
jgi:predicted alpha/beta-fold hydrolase